MKNLAGYQKDNDALEKSAKKIVAEMQKDLNEVNKQQEGIELLYRTFDKLKKSITKPGKTEADDKKAIAEIDGMLKQGELHFKKMTQALKEVAQQHGPGVKLEKEAGTLLKDLEIQVKLLNKTKSPEAKKFEALLRDTKKTAAMITGDIVKHRGSAVDPVRDKKDFDKELHAFVSDIQAGKHREKSDDDDWMEGPLDPKKVIDAGKRLKLAETKADRVLGLIDGKLAAALKDKEAPDLKLEQKAMKALFEEIRKIDGIYAKAMKQVSKDELKEAQQDKDKKADFKKLQAFLLELKQTRLTLEKRYQQAAMQQAKVQTELKKAGVKV